MPAGGCGDKKVYIKASGDFWKEKICLLLTYKENVHSTQMYIPLKPLFSRHKGIGVQFTDEPTGNLDEDTAGEIIELFQKLAHEEGICVIVVTHMRMLAEKADDVIRLENKSFFTS